MLSLTDIALYAAAGATLGGLYLGALWLTVAKLPNTRMPMVLLAVSAVLRLALLFGAFALLTGMEWKRLAACIAGFVVVRFVATLCLRPAREQQKGLIGSRAGREHL